MKIKNILLFLVFVSSLWACRTTSSSQKSTDEMSKEDFVESCNQRLQDPTEGPVINIMLKGFAKAKDCDDAYDKVKAIIAKGKS